jgi:hypothetical protein
VLLLLLVPSVVVIVGSVGLCLIPVGALVCIGLGLHFCAPETLSNVALVRDQEQEEEPRPWICNSTKQQRQQWDANWTLANFLLEQQLQQQQQQQQHALVIESRSRTDLEQLFLVKRVVAADPGQDQT